jgi:hypothetical protein
MNYSRKLISVSGYNYVRLKRLGIAGDNFNDVLTYVLDVVKKKEVNKRLLRGESGLDPRFTSAAICKPNIDRLGEIGIAER